MGATRHSESLRFQWANDTHSGLNATRVARALLPETAEEVALSVSRHRHAGQSFAIAGGRHAMGGQQFLSNGTLLDMRRMNAVRSFDAERGLLEVEAGMTWPDVMRAYLKCERPDGPRWGVRQKQTGADRLTIGGAVSANIHGRALTAPPFVADIESLEVVNSNAEILHCSRTCNADLFRYVVGGYGLFGVVTAATLRLVPRVQVERVVTMMDVDNLIGALDSRIAAGYLYGDFQFATDPGDSRFLRTGVLSCYRPTGETRSIETDQKRLSQQDWNRLVRLAHCDKRRAFQEFSDFYLATSGQVYWSDTHQLNLYLESYHGALDARLGRTVPGGEMITELYVPRNRLPQFMDEVRRDFRKHAVDCIYGTIRLIERDTETALPWAREAFVCVIFNLHVDHEPLAIGHAESAFRRLIDYALAYRGSYYLTYHRYATVRQLLAAHPTIVSVMQAKRALDPGEVFQSDWYRHTQGQLQGAHS